MIAGNVLHMELLLASRRSKQFIWRYLYAGWLVLEFCWYFIGYYGNAWAATQFGPGSGFDVQWDATMQFAGGFMTMFIWQQLILLMLVTPAMSAGAITDEKESGTLQYLLSAGLTSTEIILGKLLGRLVMVGNVFVAGIPFLFLLCGFIGISFGLALAIVLQGAAAAFALAAASLLASVWAKQTRDAILQLYAVGALVLIGIAVAGQITVAGPAAGAKPEWWFPILQWVVDTAKCFDPTYALEPVWQSNEIGELGRRIVVHILAWCLVGVLCLMVAIARLRPAYFKQLEGMSKRKRALIWWARPPVSSEPVRWKERFVAGIAPLPVFRYIPRWFVMGVILIGTTATVIAMAFASYLRGTVNNAWGFDIGYIHPELRPFDPIYLMNGLLVATVTVVILASLIVGIRCSGAITGERERHTWEALLLTPLETPSLVKAKLWGIVGATYPYLLMYAIPMGLFSLLAGPTGVIVFAVSLGATWLAMFYVGAAGLWCSARSTSSWRSLLGMFAWAYLGGFIVSVALAPVLMSMWIMISLLFILMEQLLTGRISGAGPFDPKALFVSGYIMAALSFLLGSWFFLKEAEKRVADFDRTRHWRNEPKRRPRVVPKQVREWEQSGYR
jgi:ABC-type transport system involved in multi-copper enzyme maturation permease subunit